jgi:thioredoxin 1
MKPYETEPERAVVESASGPLIVEFGTNWCGYCQAAQPVIESALADHADIQHLKVEDGKGRPLGRAFGVRLWPTLVFLQDGKEVTRVVRPTAAQEVRDALRAIAPA